MTNKNVRYRDYITSPEWYGKHKEFLKQAHYRCAFTLVPVGKGRRYNIHHTDYINLGSEVYGEDVLVSCNWFHKWVLHGLLSGFKSAGRQRTPYPNRAQRLVHNWGRLPFRVKQLLLWLFLLTGVYGVSASALFLSGLELPSEGTKPIWAVSTQFIRKSALKASKRMYGKRTNLLPQLQNQSALPVLCQRPGQPQL